jgi:competence protein ComEC
MASLFLVAEALGRQRGTVAALALAAAVMTGISPYILGDASFQLSFLAMAGLIFIYPVFGNFGKQIVSDRLGDKGTFVSLVNLSVDMISVTLGAIIAVWPLTAYYFGTFSTTGPLATFVLTPVQPVIIILGMPAALAGLASGLMAQIFGWLLWPFLTYMILVVRGLGSPAMSSVGVAWINPGFITGYYAVLALLVWRYSRRQRGKSLISGAAGTMKAGVNLAYGLGPVDNRPGTIAGGADDFYRGHHAGQ